MKSTASVWGVILILVVIAVLAYGIVKVRRARDEHRTRSNERAAAMLLAMHQETTRSRPGTSMATGPAAAPMPAPAPAPAQNKLQRKSRLLDENHRLLYLVLRAALTDHVIVPHIRVADLIDADASPAYGERETKLRLLLQERIDCVVCTNDLVPLAAVMIYDGSSGVPEERIKADTLRELGMRFLRFRSDSLPKPAEMRGLILG